MEVWNVEVEICLFCTLYCNVFCDMNYILIVLIVSYEHYTNYISVDIVYVEVGYFLL